MQRNRKACGLLLASVVLTCATLTAAKAQDNKLATEIDSLLRVSEPESYSLLTTIPVNGLAAFDISAVDPAHSYYYLADRTNAALDIFSTTTNTLVKQVTGFAGVVLTNGVANNSLSGPDGVALVGPNEIWVGDGDSSVKVIDLTTNTIVQTISTTLPGQTAATDQRADEMAYDPLDHVLVVANNAASPPYVTFISTQGNRPVLGHIVYTAAAGVEASVFDPAAGVFYINLTQFGTDVNSGAVSVVDPRQLKEIREFPVYGCNGAGISLAPKHKLLVGCSLTNNSQIFDPRDGTLLATIPRISGSDETYYNKGDGKFYLAARYNPASQGGPVLGVIDAVTNKYVTSIPTDISAHSVAADSKTNHIFVPLGISTSTNTDTICPTGCIAVYAGKEKEGPADAALETFLSDLGK